jgi:RNA polymerase sigma-70 factor, ECF subfamily
MDKSDKEQIALYMRGDVNALSELVERYRRPLFGFIIKMTEGKDDADEIFQEIWVRAIKHIDRYEDRKLLSWLFRIAHNLIIDRARRRKDLVSLDQENEHEHALSEVLPGTGPSPADDSGNEDLRLRIRTAVEALPDEQKEVFLMRMEGDLSFKEIAKIQGTSINTALGRMQYALQKLRGALAEDYALLGRNPT